MRHRTLRSALKAIGLFSMVALLAAILSGVLVLHSPAEAQSVRPPENAVVNARPGEPAAGGAPAMGPVGGAVPGDVLGTTSDSEIWRQIRQGGQFTTQVKGPNAGELVQSEGWAWQAFRAGPLRDWGAWALGGMLGLLVLFYLVRGRVRIEAGPSGEKIERFSGVERFGHWLLAGSFVILAITGLTLLYGRPLLIPVVGKEAFAAYQGVGKLLHNYLAFAFMAGLVLVFLLWVAHNIPGKLDLIWLAKGGGLFSKHSHPSSRKFNAGQKIVFWLVVLLGVSLSLSGLALIFPYQLGLFGKTFVFLNGFGFNLPTDLTPLQEMQLSALWHAIVGLAAIAVILAHIYIGTIGMEGAFDAMGTGQVDRNWALEHHDLWVEDVEAKAAERRRGAPPPDATPAE